MIMICLQCKHFKLLTEYFIEIITKYRTHTNSNAFQEGCSKGNSALEAPIRNIHKRLEKRCRHCRHHISLLFESKMKCICQVTIRNEQNQKKQMVSWEWHGNLRFMRVGSFLDLLRSPNPCTHKAPTNSSRRQTFNLTSIVWCHCNRKELFAFLLWLCDL